MAVNEQRPVKEFYEHSKKDEQTKYEYPDIVPDVMSSLAELLEIELTIQDVMLKFLKVLYNPSPEGYLRGAYQRKRFRCSKTIMNVLWSEIGMYWKIEIDECDLSFTNKKPIANVLRLHIGGG